MSEITGRHRQRSTRLQLADSHTGMRITISPRVSPQFCVTAKSFVPYLPRCFHPQQTPTGDSFAFDSEDGQVIEEVVGPAGPTD